MNICYNQDKAALRRRFRSARDSLSPAERAAAEAALYESLFSLPAWHAAPLICGYISVRGEIGTAPIWARAAAEGKGYALPVTVTGPAEGRMIFRRTAGFAPEALIPARFGLSEPADTCPALAPTDFEGALILVPGLAFDDGGYRIGYGGGYYDRFLQDLQTAGIRAVTVGAAFACCRTARLPRDPHDIPVDIILDERRTTVPPWKIN